MIEGMMGSGDNPPSTGGRRSTRQSGWRRGGRWVVLAVLLAFPAAAAAYLISNHEATPHKAPVGRRSESIGNERLARAASGCKLSPVSHNPPAGLRGSLLLGLNSALRLFPSKERCVIAKLTKETGVQAAREDLSWATTEPRPNRYDWSGYDAVVATATKAGLTLLPIIDDAPSWAAPTPASVPANPTSYAAFVAAAVARYGQGGSFWRANPDLPKWPLTWFELWNEPYFADHNRDPTSYARLVRAAVTAGRAANPAARFLIEATTSYLTLSGEPGDWLASMYAAEPDLGRYFDGLAIHPYGGDPAELASKGDIQSPSAQVQQARAELIAHGDGDKPLWVTEIGWSTCSGLDVCVTEAQQAAYLRTFLTLASTAWRQYVQAVFVFALRDLAPNPPDNRDAWFGLLRPDLSRKPAWYVLRAAALHGTS
jgi:hypothetical protein